MGFFKSELRIYIAHRVGTGPLIADFDGNEGGVCPRFAQAAPQSNEAAVKAAVSFWLRTFLFVTTD